MLPTAERYYLNVESGLMTTTALNVSFSDTGNMETIGVGASPAITESAKAVQEIAKAVQEPEKYSALSRRPLPRQVLLRQPLLHLTF